MYMYGDPPNTFIFAFQMLCRSLVYGGIAENYRDWKTCAMKRTRFFGLWCKAWKTDLFLLCLLSICVIGSGLVLYLWSVSLWLLFQ